MAWRQCPKKLWLLTYKLELADWSKAQAVFETGHGVGDIARQQYGAGPVMEIRAGAEAAVALTSECMARGQPHIYEAAFIHEGVLVMADVLERVNEAPPWRYRLVEVKSSTSVKDIYLDDVAVQSWVMQGSGCALNGMSIAHINKQFVYSGANDYRGLLIEASVDEPVALRRLEVAQWVNDSKTVLAGDEPAIGIGEHCHYPYTCPFLNYCTPKNQPEYPLSCLPYPDSIVEGLEAEGYRDLRDIPEGRLIKDKHLRVWQMTRTGKPFLDLDAVEAIHVLPYPRYYLDFETIAFAVPCWVGTRPFQALPFQWSLHREDADGTLHHEEFLDTTGKNPMRTCMSALLDALGADGPIMVYSSYESRMLKEMAAFLPELAQRLLAVRERLFDLLPLMRAHYYHPAMKGSWSIKAVLPTIAPDLDYSTLAVSDGGDAQAAYLEMVAPQTLQSRRQELQRGLLEYCGQDTLALFKVARFVGSGGRINPKAL